MIREIWDPEQAGARVLALGTFDGMHLGHQALIRKGKQVAEEKGVLLRVCTFDRHPLEVVAPEKAPELLTSIGEKRCRLEECGADEMRVLPFTREMAEKSPLDFLRQLREETGVTAVIAGWNYTFGHRGEGTAQTLREDGERYGYRVEIVPPVQTPGGETVSSTAVRNLLKQGDLAGAEEMLGVPYRICGKVVQGKQIGHQIGAATANVEIGPRKLLPPYGVYVCTLFHEGKAFPAVVNIGIQPTLPSGRATVEAHVLKGSPDLYGSTVRLDLHRFLRKERKFESVSALKSQIEADIRNAADWWDRDEKTGGRSKSGPGLAG